MSLTLNMCNDLSWILNKNITEHFPLLRGSIQFHCVLIDIDGHCLFAKTKCPNTTTIDCLEISMPSQCLVFLRTGHLYTEYLISQGHLLIFQWEGVLYQVMRMCW